MTASVGFICQLAVNWELSSAREVVKVEPKRVKVKNFHC
jgi:hypothetical protein